MHSSLPSVYSFSISHKNSRKLLLQNDAIGQVKTARYVRLFGCSDRRGLHLDHICTRKTNTMAHTVAG